MTSLVRILSVAILTLTSVAPVVAQESEIQRAYTYSWGTGIFAPSVTSSGPQYSFDGALDTPSPRFFQPGFGYASPRIRFAPSQFQYSPLSSFGMTSPQSPYSTGFGGSLSLPGSSPLSRYGLDLWTPGAGTLHAPWYLPGSPGNYR